MDWIWTTVEKQQAAKTPEEAEMKEIKQLIDKGTFDSVCCGDAAEENAKLMLSEISRVLQPGVTYICVSYGMKELRMLAFDKQQYNWTVTHTMVPKPTMGNISSEQQKELAKDEKLKNEDWERVKIETWGEFLKLLERLE